MSATIIPFPKHGRRDWIGCSPTQAARLERMAELLCARAKRSGMACSMAKARLAVDSAIADLKGGAK